MSTPREFPCLLCNKRTKSGDRRYLLSNGNKHLRKYIKKTFLIENIKSHDVICGRCRRVYYRCKEQQSKCTETPARVPDPDNTAGMSSPKNISLPLQSIGGSHSCCLVCKRRGPKLIVVSETVRFNFFIHFNVMIPSGSRCCPIHIDSGSFTDEASNLMSNFRKQTDVNRTDIMYLLQKSRETLLQNGDKRINFDSVLSDSDLQNLTGLNRISFENLLSHLTAIRDTSVRSRRTCLGLFLTKLRTGMSNKVLSTLFNISKDCIRKAISSVRKNLKQTFVPSNIGFQHITREQVIEDHTRPLAQTLFGKDREPAILVIDGTYLYIQKSNQFSFQRRSYSLHKHRPLIKPMVFVTTTGYFVSVMGPYLSDNSNNDAKIMQHIIATDSEEIRQWMTDGDVFIVDRGFRDSIDTLKDLGIRTEMPSFLEKGQKQLSTEDSNTSRLVTKIRWVVESANGRLKSWKYFEKIIPNTQIPYIADYIQIICGLCNKYLPPLSDGSQEEDEAVGCKMLYLAKQSNLLKMRIENEGLDKVASSKTWQTIDSTGLVFPKMTEDDIRALTIGIYQVNLAKSYTAEHLNEDSEYKVLLCVYDPRLLCARLQSRHISSKVYLLWISHDEATVKSWYCRCKTGSRVVGMCAHVTSVVWYLGYARHTSRPFCYVKDWTHYLKDAKNLPEPETLDESDDGDETVEE